MKTFNGDPALKERLLARAIEHREHDNYLSGAYWTSDGQGTWKGCSIGCLSHEVNQPRERVEDRDGYYCYEDRQLMVERVEEEFFLPRWFLFSCEAAFEGAYQGLTFAEEYGDPYRGPDHTRVTEELIKAVPVGAEFPDFQPPGMGHQLGWNEGSFAQVLDYIESLAPEPQAIPRKEGEAEAEPVSERNAV